MAAKGVELGTAYVTLLPSTRGFSKAVNAELQGVERQAKASGKRAGDELGDGIEQGGKKGTGKLGGLLKAGLVGAAAAAGVAAGAVFAKSIAQASNLEQSKGGVEAIFKDQAAGIQAASKDAATGVGLTQNAYNELATTLGAGLKNKGIEDFAGQTQSLIGLGADLAAQFGGTTQDAVAAVSSLMRGETDPIEKYGVAINETAIKAELAARGQDKLTGAALEQAKAQARVDILMRQTADAQGAFGRESDTLAGKQQRAAAQWQDLQAKIGGAFLPAMTSAMGFVSDVALPALDSLGSFLGDVGGKVGAFFSQPPNPAVAAAFDGVRGAVEGMWAVVQPIVDAVVQTITTKWAEIAPQVDVIFADVRDIITNVMSVIQSVITIATDAIKSIWATWGDEILRIVNLAIDLVVGVFSGFVGIAQGIWQTLASLLKGDTQGMMDGVKQVFSGAFGVLETLFSGAVSALGVAWSAIKSVFAEPVNWVINNVLNPLIDKIKSIASTFGVKFSTDGGTGGSEYQMGSAYAAGGYTGPGGKYKPAGIVHAGEVVFSQDDVDAWGGPAAVDAMRRFRGYASGGVVGNIAGLDPVFLAALQAWASASGYSGSIGPQGGYRSYEEQLALWNKSDKTGRTVASPGNSRHNFGTAADVSPYPTAAQAAMMAAFGIGRPMSYEPWHIQLGGSGSGVFGGPLDVVAMLKSMVGDLLNFTVPGGGVMVDIMKAIPGKVLDWGGDWLKGKLGFDSGGWLAPGKTLANNATGQPEAVLTSGQWRDISSLASGSRTNRLHPDDLRELANIIDRRPVRVDVDGRQIASSVRNHNRSIR